MRLSTVSFFADSTGEIKADIHQDNNNDWPVTLRISAKDYYPYISIFMRHEELVCFVSSLQEAFESYIEQYNRDNSYV